LLLLDKRKHNSKILIMCVYHFKESIDKSGFKANIKQIFSNGGFALVLYNNEIGGCYEVIAHIILTPTESKKLIAKTLVKRPDFLDAMEKGLIVLHPSSSTYFIVEEVTGAPPPTDVWVIGVITQKGLCVEKRTNVEEEGADLKLKSSLENPGKFPHSWVFENGVLKHGIPLDELLDKMHSTDIYVKGVNAIDKEGIAGVWLGSLVEGTIGQVVKMSRAKNFKIFCPVGIEKFIPGSMEEAKKVSRSKIFYSMGCKVKLFSFKPDVLITEIEAFEMFSEVKATITSAGGLAGAEGAVCITLEGKENALLDVIELAEKVKGAELPEIKLPNCLQCNMPTCYFPGLTKHWV